MKKVKKLKEFKLFLLILLMELSEFFDLEKVMSKIAPYIAIFVFGYSFALERTLIYGILFFLSLISGAYFIIFKQDDLIKIMAILLHSKGKGKKKYAKWVSQYSARLFILKGYVGFLSFFLILSSALISLGFVLREFSITWLILLIISAFSTIFSIIFTISKRKNIKNIVKLIKESANQNKN